MMIFCFVSSELLWPEGDEALSEHAVGAVESILILQAEYRPGAKGIVWDRGKDNFISFTWEGMTWSSSVLLYFCSTGQYLWCIGGQP